MGSVKAFVQARMSSQRFPGKVLAPFRGEPLISHVVRRVGQVLSLSDIVVTTSRELSDDPLASYLQGIRVQVFRGPLNNVFERFRLCLAVHPCDWILRVSADSPLLDAGVLKRVIGSAELDDCDLVSTIFPSRTFPSGQNAELIKTSSFLSVTPDQLSPDDEEHVTPFFYRHSDRYRIQGIASRSHETAAFGLAVDSVEDLKRIESLREEEFERYRS